MIIQIEGFSETGFLRENNQDRIFYRQSGKTALAVLADGMGGHEEGEKASTAICDMLRRWWDTRLPGIDNISFIDTVEELKGVLQETNEYIRNITEKGTLCGSTVVLLWLFHGKWALLSAGDSRCYLMRQIFFCGQISQISVDDLWETQEEIKRKYNRKQRKESPDYGRLSRAVGTEKQFDSRVKFAELSGRMVFCLCSDGVYRYCKKREIRNMMHTLLKGNDMSVAVEQVRKSVYENGAPDNLSLIAVRVL